MGRYLFILFIFLSSTCFGYKTLLTQDEYIYEVYEPGDRIPVDTLVEGLQMYYKAYLFPKLHVGFSLKELNIDETRFRSYDEFIEDMFCRDFLSYQTTQKEQRYYFQVRTVPHNQVVCVCVLLKEQEPGFYYMDHIGTHKDYRRRGLAYTLIEQVKRHLTDFRDISLDTRIFNVPAQALYAKSGFHRLAVHPIPKKQNIYYHYLYRVDAARTHAPCYSTESK